MPKKQKPFQLPAAAYDTVPRAQITLTDETMWLTKFDPRGAPNVTHPVAARDVARAFNLFGQTTGLLPADCLFWTATAAQARLGIWLPPARRTLTFDLGKRKVSRLTVPLPGLVFAGQGTRYYIYAANERPADDGARLYCAPLPNVDGDGKICAGTVKFPTCAANTIAAAANLFFESAFNHDLSTGKVQGTNDTLYQVLRSLETARAFPPKLLVPMRRALAQIMEVQS